MQKVPSFWYTAVNYGRCPTHRWYPDSDRLQPHLRTGYLEGPTKSKFLPDQEHQDQ